MESVKIVSTEMDSDFQALLNKSKTHVMVSVKENVSVASIMLNQSQMTELRDFLIQATRKF